MTEFAFPPALIERFGDKIAVGLRYGTLEDRPGASEHLSDSNIIMTRDGAAGDFIEMKWETWIEQQKRGDAYMLMITLTDGLSGEEHLLAMYVLSLIKGAKLTEKSNDFHVDTYWGGLRVSKQFRGCGLGPIMFEEVAAGIR
jgi:hypothetical protein